MSTKRKPPTMTHKSQETVNKKGIIWTSAIFVVLVVLVVVLILLTK
ncbi:hypothetical protein [Paenibacillus selenitireducens]|nr:hypothetical protein [Paenibacillus selenitireducens]